MKSFKSISCLLVVVMAVGQTQAESAFVQRLAQVRTGTAPFRAEVLKNLDKAKSFIYEHKKTVAGIGALALAAGVVWFLKKRRVAGQNSNQSTRLTFTQLANDVAFEAAYPRCPKTVRLSPELQNEILRHAQAWGKMSEEEKGTLVKVMGREHYVTKNMTDGEVDEFIRAVAQKNIVVSPEKGREQVSNTLRKWIVLIPFNPDGQQ